MDRLALCFELVSNQVLTTNIYLNNFTGKNKLMEALEKPYDHSVGKNSENNDKCSDWWTCY